MRTHPLNTLRRVFKGPSAILRSEQSRCCEKYTASLTENLIPQAQSMTSIPRKGRTLCANTQVSSRMLSVAIFSVCLAYRLPQKLPVLVYCTFLLSHYFDCKILGWTIATIFSYPTPPFLTSIFQHQFLGFCLKCPSRILGFNQVFELEK